MLKTSGVVILDIKYMYRALDLAKKGVGFTNPNPLVGAVIVKDGRIIGEGYHKFYGGDHAEINAISSASEDVSGAEMYVTLEPCSHYGKTPPCVDAIIKNRIKKVIIGFQDPNPLVSGRGIKFLRENGVEVVTGVLENEGKALNEIYLKYISTGLPFCIMKTAMTLDGKIATYTGDSKWITGELSRKYVHQLRHRVSGIIVGIGTVLADDPMLTTRIKDGRDAARIIVDSSGKIPLEAKVLHVQSAAPTIIATTAKADKDKITVLKQIGTQVIVTPIKEGAVDLSYLMKALGEMKIDSILLEGGSKLNFSALKEGIVDKVNAFIAPKIIGGDMAKTAVGGRGAAYMKEAIPLKNIEIHHFGPDIMLEGWIEGKEGV
ncbi:bifunctional diaminohydroxyphosphoribosylaminopyrimidine deaminase/5-amino-6-(5-phosphoribosylamino)uracil reductase RibD [Bacillaceae bacterium Marseille-Q3522]|nr:bifunctional diaminohydroxyphosphoribosylaminopyrimidine deaminase/5-amino-6-(5-phosphoribosylamino)uracil reductase RibD [Bacillaceae bacterium Marseille-Q3522]